MNRMTDQLIYLVISGVPVWDIICDLEDSKMNPNITVTRNEPIYLFFYLYFFPASLLFLPILLNILLENFLFS